MAQPVQPTPLLLTFASYSYRHLCANWLRALAQVQCPAPLVCALDKPMGRWLRARGVHCRDTPLAERRWRWRSQSREKELGTLWRLRMKVIREFLAQGYSVLHSDLDAVWRKDPLPLLNDPQWDVVASQGTNFPQAFFDRFGFVLCMGFIYFRPRPQVLSWMTELLEALDRDPRPDDQRALNFSLLHSTPIPGGLICPPLRIGMLPQHLVSRGTGGEYVAHPLAAKEAVAKRTSLEQAGLWSSPLRARRAWQPR